MKKETWKTVIQVIVSILTAALTALGTTSCMGHGPIAIWSLRLNTTRGLTDNESCRSFFYICLYFRALQDINRCFVSAKLHFSITFRGQKLHFSITFRGQKLHFSMIFEGQKLHFSKKWSSFEPSTHPPWTPLCHFKANRERYDRKMMRKGYK